MTIVNKNIKLATIYRPLNNIFLNPFMEFLRRKYVCKNQIKKILKATKDEKISNEKVSSTENSIIDKIRK